MWGLSKGRFVEWSGGLWRWFPWHLAEKLRQRSGCCDSSEADVGDRLALSDAVGDHRLDAAGIGADESAFIGAIL